MLRFDALAAKTRPVYELMAQQKALENFVLIGGTAMALHIGHRLSEDLDFWLPAERMSPYAIDRMMNDLRAQGHSVVFATPSASISAFRINSGEDLRWYAQDWAIDGVKVQLFCPQDVAFDHFRVYPRLKAHETGASFEIATLEAIFAMKSYTISRRTRSRDIVDLWHFVQRGKTLADILRVARLASPSVSDEHAKAVLCGDVPLDVQDEGFALLAPGLRLPQVYADFAKAIDALEIEQARQVAKLARQANQPHNATP
jgi:predicted nucleotidyltransferase component of viral defense system